MPLARLLLLAVSLTLATCARDEPPIARLEIDAQPGSIAYPEFVSTMLRWQVLPDSPPNVEGKTVFVHWLDEQGELVRTFDHAFPADWLPGVVAEHEIDLYQSALGPPLEQGNYVLTVGLLDQEGRRLALETDGEDVGRNEYAMASMTIPAPGQGVSFEFEGDWEATQPGTDRQILGRRWLRREGSIIVKGGQKGDRVLIWLRIPDPSHHESRFVLEEAATVPEVEISTACGQETVVVSGVGLHRVEPHLGERIEGACRLDLKSSFVFRDTTQDGATRSAVIEVLAFREE